MQIRSLLCLYILSLPLLIYPAFTIGGFHVRFDWLLSAMIITLFVFHLVAKEEKSVFQFDSAFPWLVLFITFATLSITRPLLTGNPKSVSRFLTTWFQIVGNAVFALVLSQCLFSEKELHSFVRIYVLLAIGVSGYGIVQSALANVLGTTILFPYTWEFYSHPMLGPPGYTDAIQMFRATSILPEPRHFGSFLITPTLLVMVNYSLPGENLFEGAFATGVAFCVLVSGLLLSVSGSAYIAFAFGVLVVPFFIAANRRQLFGWFGLGPVGIGTFVVGGFVFNIRAISSTVNRIWLSQYEMANLLDFSVSLHGGASYIRGAYLLVQKSLAHPFLGAGLNQRSALLDAPVHVNVLPPFLLLASIGFVGFGAFVAFFVTTYRNASLFRSGFDRESTRYWLLTASMVFISIVVIKSTLGSKYNYANTWFWFDVAMALTILVNLKRETDHYEETTPSIDAERTDNAGAAEP